MGGAFHQGAVICRDVARRGGVNQAAGGFEGAQINVNTAHRLIFEAYRPQTVALALQQRSQVVASGCEHPGAGLLAAAGALCAIVAVQSTQALQQHIHGAQVGDEQVGINVQTLLQRLRANDHQPCTTGAGAALLAHLLLHLSIQQRPILAAETAVVQGADAAHFEQAVHCARCGQRLHGLQGGDGGGHGVAHHQHARALGRCFHGQGGNTLGLGDAVQCLPVDGFLARVALHRQQLRAASTAVADGRVGQRLRLGQRRRRLHAACANRQVACARRGPQRGRQQQRLTSAGHMGAQ